MEKILYTDFFSNPLSNYLIVLTVILGAWVIRRLVVRLVGGIVFRFLQNRFPDARSESFFNLLHSPMRLLYMLLMAGFAIKTLNYPPLLDVKLWNIPLHSIIITTYKIGLTFAIGFCLSRLVDFISFALSTSIRQSSSKTDDQALFYTRELIKLIIFISSILFILGRIFGVDVSTALAGAGIVGLAVALAVKETLQNLFSSFIIFLEQPFVIGDYVKMDAIKGIVERIGFRSTWIRTPENVLINIPNHKMVDSITENIPQTALRKVNLTLRLPYSTTTQQIQNITADIKQFIETYDQTEEKVEAGFDAFAENALLVNVNYFLLDRTDAISTKQFINFAILGIVRQHGANFATPNQMPIIVQ